MTFSGCTKDAIISPIALSSSNSINVTISSNQTYQLHLSGYAAVNIFKQASHYRASETVLNASNGSFTYIYLPITGFKGTEKVVLAGTNLVRVPNKNINYPGTNNSANSYSTSYTTINITVAN
ncbi:MAG: hypothetical protein JST47_01080 [Bacteroidetes bacterium]|nr:hypothetical protein [Bacteroidota bacterium]MBS1975558.1 hypothetical protein [Bacteroidota bacterium]